MGPLTTPTRIDTLLYSLSGVEMDEEPGLNYTQKSADWPSRRHYLVRLANTVSAYRDPNSASGTESAVFTLDFGDVNDSHSEACKIDTNKNCLDIGLQMPTKISG